MEKFIIQQLKNNTKTLEMLLQNISNKEAIWQPIEGKWSILEIVCHLIDEEIEDFRTRVFHTLQTPDLPAPPIDPEGWVKSRNYANQDYKLKVAKFLKERDQSIIQLEALENPNWNNVYNHPQIGDVSAKAFLANWLAHDYLHIRQIMKTRFLYLEHLSGLSLKYAGGV